MEAVGGGWYRAWSRMRRCPRRAAIWSAVAPSASTAATTAPPSAHTQQSTHAPGGVQAAGKVGADRRAGSGLCRRRGRAPAASAAEPPTRPPRRDAAPTARSPCAPAGGLRRHSCESGHGVGAGIEGQVLDGPAGLWSSSAATQRGRRRPAASSSKDDPPVGWRVVSSLTAPRSRSSAHSGGGGRGATARDRVKKMALAASARMRRIRKAAGGGVGDSQWQRARSLRIRLIFAKWQGVHDLA